MNSFLQSHLANAAFSPPNCDGSFDPEFEDYLHILAATRPSIVLAFAPKAAGTYLRSAAIAAVHGQLVRTVHAQGGRDASFYLPTFLMYYAGNFPARTLVTHVHMQALPANQHFIEALDLKPVIMLRSIPDMLASYLDMLEADPLSADNWLNMRVPENYPVLDDAAKADFIIDMMAPWYASYFSTWMDYAKEDRRVLVLNYDEFRADPVTTLMQLVDHSGLPRSLEQCRLALEATWTERSDLRFNKGVSGRGHTRFTAAQLDRLERQIDFYPNLAELKARLIPPSAF
jgi:Sulfotransferase domain